MTEQSKQKNYKILCVGPQWRGSNAGGLFRALSRCGHLIEIVDENYFINLSSKSFPSKVASKLSRSLCVKDFNKEIIINAKLFNPDVVLVYKGAFVLPDSLHQLRKSGLKLVNFYPDVSFKVHGGLLTETLPLYDHVFTTKTFGISDMKEQLDIINASFIPHGFDPDIHKPVQSNDSDINVFACDVSFIGGHSEKKEKILAALKRDLPDINLKIWGGKWQNCKDPILQNSIQYRTIHGDLYTLGICNSKINLALVHEQVTGASSGDKITSRTFHIPGAGGFMIHERTEEIPLYFTENKEAVFFSTTDELCSMVEKYLKDDESREQIRKQGYQRAIQDHSLDKRAEQVIDYLFG